MRCTFGPERRVEMLIDTSPWIVVFFPFPYFYTLCQAAHNPVIHVSTFCKTLVLIGEHSCCWKCTMSSVLCFRHYLVFHFQVLVFSVDVDLREWDFLITMCTFLCMSELLDVSAKRKFSPSQQSSCQAFSLCWWAGQSERLQS